MKKGVAMICRYKKEKQAILRLQLIFDLTGIALLIVLNVVVCYW